MHPVTSTCHYSTTMMLKKNKRETERGGDSTMTWVWKSIGTWWSWWSSSKITRFACLETWVIELHWGAFSINKLRKIWRERSITTNTKKRPVHSLVYSNVLNSCETWIVKAGDRQRTDAFTMWRWRRILGIKWMEMRTNDYTIRGLGYKNVSCERESIAGFQSYHVREQWQPGPTSYSREGWWQ